MKAVAALYGRDHGDVTWQQFLEIVREDWRDLRNIAGLDDELVDEELEDFAPGFFEGAAQVWDEVADKL